MLSQMGDLDLLVLMDVASTHVWYLLAMYCIMRICLLFTMCFVVVPGVDSSGCCLLMDHRVHVGCGLCDAGRMMVC